MLDIVNFVPDADRLLLFPGAIGNRNGAANFS
jgi:hypothetical protein